MTTSQQQERPRNAAYALLGLAVAAFVVRTVIGHRDFAGFDAAVYYYGAAKRYLDHVNPYDLIEVVVPPSGMLLIAPLRALSWDAAFVVMEVVSATSLIASGYVLARRFLEWSPLASATAAVAFAGLAAPAHLTTGLGNVNGLVLLAYVLALRSSLAGDERAVGLWFGVSLAIKPVLAPVWIVLVLQKRWKAVGWSFVVPAVGTALAVAISWRSIYFFTDGLHNVVADLSERFQRHNIAIGGFVRIADLPTALGSAGRVAAVAVTVAAAVALWRRFGGVPDDVRARTFQWVELGTLLFVGYLLASAFGWRYYTVYLLPLFVLACKRGTLAFHPVVWVGAALLYLPDFSGDPNPRRAIELFDAARHTGGVALTLLGLALVALGVGEKRAAE